MPSIILANMTTTSIEGEPWTSPDGKVTIWKVKLEDPSGERALHSTMSKAIAVVGWHGDVELYTNANGKEYVRSAPKEELQQSFSQSSDERGDSITAAMAVKLAFSQFCHVETMLPSEDKHWAHIEYMSDMIYKTIKQVGKDNKELAAIKQVFTGGEEL